MADRTIGDLNTAPMTVDDSNTLFVVQQAGTAYKLSGHEFILALTDILDGHGGIKTIAKTNTAGLVDTYTITYADLTTATYTVTNGKGISNIVTYYAASSSDSTVPSSWQTTKPSITNSVRYLWSYQTITYNDGTNYSTTKVVIGVYGDKGNKGDTGRGIASIVAGTRIPGQYTPYTVNMTDGTTETFRAYDGVGINSIIKTSTSGLVDTYTISFSDGTSQNYTVTNGSSIQSIAKTSTSGLEDTYTVTLTNGNTSTFTVMNGKSIVSVTQVSGTHAAGTLDTYRITFNDGDTVDFQVYNGANGTGAVSTVAGIGVSGADGDVPLLLKGNGAPTTATVGQTNQMYFDTSVGVLYICLGEAEGSYNWAGTGVMVDSTLSTTSTNPVRNSVITAKVGTIALNTTAQDLSGAVNELRSDNQATMNVKLDKTVIAPNYTSGTNTYTEGQYIIYTQKLYRCIESYTGTWNASKWEQVTVTDCKQDEITASGILKGNGNGGVSAAAAGTDYETPAGAKALGLAGASVGDLVRVSAVDANGKPTSWKHVPLCEIACNPNLLDNWYFVGGGSQQGEGIFPINQRGQQSYSGTGYTVDRWKSAGALQTVLPNSLEYMSIAPESEQYYKYFGQILGTPIPANTIITISLLYKTTRTSTYLTCNSTTTFGENVGLTALGAIPKSETINLFKVTTVLASQIKSLAIQFPSSSGFGEFHLYAIKIECGSYQTLAHQENDEWVLNELPDYGEELLRCMRYYQIFRTQSLRPTYGADFRPPMATATPTLGTSTIGGITYYTASSEA